MRRRTWVGLLLLCGVVSGIWATQPQPVFDPIYHGIPLSEWLTKIAPISWHGLPDNLTDDAREAVHAIGPAAIPTYLAWLKRSDSALSRGIQDINLPFAISSWVHANGRNRARAIYGFFELGPEARSAWPAIVALILRTDDESVMTGALHSLLQSDAATLHLLAEGTRSSNPRIRARAVRALSAHPNTLDEVALQALRQLATDPDPSLRVMAIRAVALRGNHFPDFVPLLNDSNPGVRLQAASALKFAGTDARAYLYNLEAAANDPVPAVRAAVAEAIRQVRQSTP